MTLLTWMLIGIAAVSLSPSVARATTKAAIPQTQASSTNDAPPAPYCDVDATFKAESHVAEDFSFRGRTYHETHVSWEHDITKVTPVGAGTCPTGSSFKLSIRGAEYIPASGSVEAQYVYPVDVRVPAPNQRVKASVYYQQVKDPRTGRQYSEWLVKDWEQDYKVTQ